MITILYEYVLDVVSGISAHLSHTRCTNSLQKLYALVVAHPLEDHPGWVMKGGNCAQQGLFQPHKSDWTAADHIYRRKVYKAMIKIKKTLAIDADMPPSDDELRYMSYKVACAFFKPSKQTSQNNAVLLKC